MPVALSKIPRSARPDGLPSCAPLGLRRDRVSQTLPDFETDGATPRGSPAREMALSDGSQISRLARVARIARDAGAWRPTNAAALYANIAFRRRNECRGLTDRDHLEAAAHWLGRAQDSQRDGGVAGRYRLRAGWSSSYPETTGYIIPTFLALESEAGLAGFRDRARRCVEFLLSIQLDSGAFPGLEIADNRDEPSIFNTAQILHGLLAWHKATADERTLSAVERAGDWLAGSQDRDGSWRVHLYGSGRPYTYMAHAACWLAELGEHLDRDRYLDAARRHLEWVLSRVDADTGWVDDCGFGDADQEARRGVTHTIAYTIWGILMMSRILGHDRGLRAARRAATAVARRLELSRWLPGKLDANWKGAARYACLTGNAQMALIWFELHRLESDPPLVSTACKALDLVKRAQSMTSSDPGILGGIPGSDPIWGDYITLALPNWAAKFFIDALLQKRKVLDGLTPVPVEVQGIAEVRPNDVPTQLPDAVGTRSSDVRVALLTREASGRVVQFCESWKSWGFAPAAVVIERAQPSAAAVRAANYAAEFGVLNLIRRATRRGLANRAVDSAGLAPSADGESISAYCATRQIPVMYVDSIESAAGSGQLRRLRADVFVHAGAGIMRATSLSIPALGTLNAHAGLLPPIRGMNAAEWSAFCGIPVGATVHLIDQGIDTGDILLFREAELGAASDIQSLRAAVDRTQVELLGEVLRWIRDHGGLPPRRAQHVSEGRQFFTMHDSLRHILNAALETRSAGAPGRPGDEQRALGPSALRR